VVLKQALVPYYRQILPMLNLFTRQNGAYDRQEFMDISNLKEHVFVTPNEMRPHLVCLVRLTK
jgi:hypothetical protein